MLINNTDQLTSILQLQKIIILKNKQDIDFLV